MLFFSSIQPILSLVYGSGFSVVLVYAVSEQQLATSDLLQDGKARCRWQSLCYFLLSCLDVTIDTLFDLFILLLLDLFTLSER